MILEDGFNKLNSNQYDASPSGEILKVQSNAPIELKRGNIAKEVMGEYIATHIKEQALKEVTIEQEAQHVFAHTKLVKYATTTAIFPSIEFITTIVTRPTS